MLRLVSGPAASAASPSSGWAYESLAGGVRVSADRSHITVCDLHDDGYSIDTEYATSRLGIYPVPDSNGPRAGCGTDRSFISRIDVFKMCATLDQLRSCADPVWIKRH